VPQHLDASIDVFRQRRSQLDSLDCEQTDGGGRASAGFDAQDGQAYLIRISRRVGSVAGPFRLTSAAVQPAARPPGPRLPAAGARNSVNRTLNPSDAYSVRLRQGVTYRVNLAVSRCANLEIYRPGTRSFSGGSRVETLSCGGAATSCSTFAPGARSTSCCSQSAAAACAASARAKGTFASVRA